MKLPAFASVSDVSPLRQRMWSSYITVLPYATNSSSLLRAATVQVSVAVDIALVHHAQSCNGMSFGLCSLEVKR